ncbi:hypothetical protein BDZ91DRAFT_320145 [Kalaharituber pfeilii]|nr:hypothetical protein BDZ91DRAFT_320145 [Kalaharituber pfeilii]
MSSARVASHLPHSQACPLNWNPSSFTLTNSPGDRSSRQSNSVTSQSVNSSRLNSLSPGWHAVIDSGQSLGIASPYQLHSPSSAPSPQHNLFSNGSIQSNSSSWALVEGESGSNMSSPILLPNSHGAISMIALESFRNMIEFSNAGIYSAQQPQVASSQFGVNEHSNSPSRCFIDASSIPEFNVTTAIQLNSSHPYPSSSDLSQRKNRSMSQLSVLGTGSPASFSSPFPEAQSESNAMEATITGPTNSSPNAFAQAVRGIRVDDEDLQLDAYGEGSNPEHDTSHDHTSPATTLDLEDNYNIDARNGLRSGYPIDGDLGHQRRRSGDGENSFDTQHFDSIGGPLWPVLGIAPHAPKVWQRQGSATPCLQVPALRARRFCGGPPSDDSPQLEASIRGTHLMHPHQRKRLYGSRVSAASSPSNRRATLSQATASSVPSQHARLPLSDAAQPSQPPDATGAFLFYTSSPTTDSATAAGTRSLKRQSTTQCTNLATPGAAVTCATSRALATSALDDGVDGIALPARKRMKHSSTSNLVQHSSSRRDFQQHQRIVEVGYTSMDQPAGSSSYDSNPERDHGNTQCETGIVSSDGAIDVTQGQLQHFETGFTELCDSPFNSVEPYPGLAEQLQHVHELPIFQPPHLTNQNQQLDAETINWQFNSHEELGEFHLQHGSVPAYQNFHIDWDPQGFLNWSMDYAPEHQHDHDVDGTIEVPNPSIEVVTSHEEQQPPTLAPSSLPTKKTRGPFDPRRRGEVNEIRKRGACIRCQFLRESCDMNERCANCCKVEGKQKTWRYMPCIRMRITEAMLFRKGNSKFKQAEANLLSLHWAHGARRKTITLGRPPPLTRHWIAKGHTTLPSFKIHCKEFVPRQGDLLHETWRDANGDEVRLKLPPFAACEEGDTSEAIRGFVRDVFEFFKYDMVSEEQNPLVRLVFEEAIRYSEDHECVTDVKSSSDKQPICMLRDALRIWILSRLAAEGVVIVGSERPFDIDVVDSPDSPYYGTVPIPPILDHQLDTLGIRYMLQLKDNVLKALKARIQRRRHTHWYEVFLTMFVLLHNIEYVYRAQYRYMKRHEGTIMDGTMGNLCKDAYCTFPGCPEGRFSI